jgi:hypothetical protein
MPANAGIQGFRLPGHRRHDEPVCDGHDHNMRHGF